MTTPSIVWFRQDLRLADNPALQRAIDRGGPVVPVYIWAPREEGEWAPASASRWWLHQSLLSLDADLQAIGSRLTICVGPTRETLVRLARSVGARAVFWNRRYEPAVIERDTAVKTALRDEGLVAESTNGSLLFDPVTIRNKEGKPYQVFTPYWRACTAGNLPERPEPAPTSLPAPESWPKSTPVGDLELEPTINWAEGMRKAWVPGEKGAKKRLEVFLERGLSTYADDRNRPDLEGTSALSPYLHFGEISPRTIWHAVCDQHKTDGKVAGLPGGPEVYLKEVVWREFAHHLLFHFPHTTDKPLRPEFAAFPWRDDATSLRAWRKGRTGYPLVDAGMRELWTTGWMHNRVRMVVASFLVKHLLVPWQVGAKWFWDTLVDADLANNTLGWQWTAGCGADAAPYFRIFNPISQGEKFDPTGEYVRHWVPELAKLPDKVIHEPWQASAAVLREAGVVPGETYPRPIVDHEAARDRALQAFGSLSRPAT